MKNNLEARISNIPSVNMVLITVCGFYDVLSINNNVVYDQK